MALTVLMRPGDGCCMRSPRNETGADHRPRWTQLLFLLGLARRLRDARLAARAFGPVVVRRERVRREHEALCRPHLARAAALPIEHLLSERTLLALFRRGDVPALW